ncbi:MAG TPA: SDR family oxidoreductase [Anaeromyxobacteraceae bacterium]|nr:SDR family oxidoreductase [Anaeromyxobacteraceae bacterium]
MSEGAHPTSDVVTVTGATGHLGNVLVRQLLRCGKRVRALVLPDDDCRPLAGLPVEVVRGDVIRQATLAPAFRGAQLVFHLAGVVSVSSLDAELLHEVHVVGTHNVIAACREAGVRRLVYTSTVHAIAEPPPGGVLTEESGFHPERMFDAYGRAKAEASRAVVRAAQDGIDAVLVLPVAVLGPFDYRLSPVGRLIGMFARGRLPAVVEGGYDFVDVRDVARGHVLAAERGRRGEAYLLTGGRLTVREVMRVLSEEAGRPAPRIVIPLPVAAGLARFTPLWERITGRRAIFTPDAVRTISARYGISDEKARRELGFSTMPVDRSLREAWRWMTSDPGSPLLRAAANDRPGRARGP